jgi:hypothetical protein
MEEHVMAIQPRPLLGRRRREDPLDELAGTPKSSVTAWAAAREVLNRRPPS